MDYVEIIAIAHFANNIALEAAEAALTRMMTELGIMPPVITSEEKPDETVIRMAIVVPITNWALDTAPSIDLQIAFAEQMDDACYLSIESESIRSIVA